MPSAPAAPTVSAARYAVRPADPDAPALDACPLLLSMVAAGFPSPAEDYIDRSLNLHAYVMRRPAATYFVWAEGESMTGAGICPGDLLIVDKSILRRLDRVVIAVLDGDFAVKWYREDAAGPWLESANPRFPPIRPAEGQELTIWGVVTFVLHKF